MTPLDSKIRWLVSQEGTRETYGVPVAFAKLGCLRLFYADVWCRWGRSWLRRGSAGARALSGPIFAKQERQQNQPHRHP